MSPEILGWAMVGTAFVVAAVLLYLSRDAMKGD
jgi:hypothetical protein